MTQAAAAAPDPVWQRIRQEAARQAEREPVLAAFFDATILRRRGLEEALSALLAGKLASATLRAETIGEVIDQALARSPEIGRAARADVRAFEARDPACRHFAAPLLWFKGFHALQVHRVAHWLWQQGRDVLALSLQNRMSEVFGVDVHPAARIGAGILIDHGTSVVIGETAVVEDDVSLLHEVTLGGTGKTSGDRHPKVRAGVLIGAGAKILGNVEVGEGAKVAAGSVVLEDVPPHCTVAGVPARVVGRPHVERPALEMDQSLREPSR